MKRRTSALSVSAAAATTFLLLTGCSTGAHPGAAAVVGGERISVAAVQDQVETVRDAQRAQPEGDQLISASAGLTRATVANLVQLRVVEAAAADAGVEVTRRDVQEERDRAEESVGGAEALEQVLLMPASGMPVAGDEQIDQLLRGQLLVQRLAERLGLQPGANGQAELAEVLARTAEDIGVEINPRYGAWDPEQVWLSENAAAQSPWIQAAGEGEAGPVTLDG